ncbi:MAG: hypothetical protein M1820_009522 [Bogoriella megaspora]|nr:MAG: hypothetical protein M1820_009522 [Bogoriella megaspora]
MAALRPSYMLVPNWDFPADGAIALGNIVKDPKRPDRALYKANLDAALVTSITKNGWSFSSQDVRNGSVGLWASALAKISGLGGEASTNASRNLDDVWKCDELETRYFEPSDDFISGALFSEIVTIYTGNRWWKSVYMITGLKIAKGATIETTVDHSHESKGKVGIDGTLVGAPVSAGPDGRYEHKKRRATRFGTNSDIVIAYRLLKITPKNHNAFKTEDYNKFALLGEEACLGEEPKSQAVQKLHEMWDIEVLEQPTSDDEWHGIEIIPADELDCNLLVPQITSPRES